MSRLSIKQAITLTVIIVFTALALTIGQALGFELEPGATFYGDNTCQEADGTPGISAGDGECITTEDYNTMFSYDNLSTTESQTDPSRSVAEVYNITPDSLPASLRLIGVGLLDEPFTFVRLFGGQVAL